MTKRVSMRLMCPGCFSYISALVDPIEGREAVSGDIAICQCGSVSIYDRKTRPNSLRHPTIAEQAMISGNASYQRLVARKANRSLQ